MNYIPSVAKVRTAVRDLDAPRLYLLEWCACKFKKKCVHLLQKR